MKILVIVAALLPVSAALPGHAQQSKTAGEAFKNVQVLKRVPADQWYDTMAFIAGSLGVTCDHCHSSDFAVDEGNPAKLKARKMMQMVDAINAQHFDGHNVITCNSCHRGDPKPQGAPVPDAEHWITSTASAPPASEILSRYRKSVSTIKGQSLSLRIEKYGGKGPAIVSSADVLLEGNKTRISNREGNHAKTMLRNGEEAWIDEGSGWRAMRKGETFDAFEVAQVLTPDQVGEVEPSGEAFETRLNGASSYVVPVTARSQKKLLFFDPNRGVLLKKRLFFQSFYGEGSIDVNYGDFKSYGETWLPSTVEVVNAGGPGLIVRRVLSRQVNPELPPETFEHRP